MRDILCTDVKYSGLLLRDKRFDHLLTDKKTKEYLSSTEDSTSGTESLSLSVSLTDGSLEVRFIVPYIVPCLVPYYI